MASATAVPNPVIASPALASPVVSSPAVSIPPASAECKAQCRAAQALKQSSHPALRRLRVEETEGALVISGRVSTYYLKQLAQETIMSVRRDLALVNQVMVAKE